MFCVIMIVSINAKPLCDYSFLSFSIHRGAEYQRLLRRKNKISAAESSTAFCVVMLCQYIKDVRDAEEE